MCDKIVSNYPLKLIHCHVRYKTQEMCNNKAVNNFFPESKFVPDWFVTSKMMENLIIALYSYKNIFYYNKDSGVNVPPCNEMDILGIYVNNIKLDDSNFDEDDPETIILVSILAWRINYGKRKALKIV